MASRIEHQSPVTLGGVAALCSAIGLCALGIGQQTRPMPSSPMLVLVLLACAGGLIVVLARVRLPQMVKMGSIFATLCVMMLTVATGDMFGVKATAKAIDKATSHDDSLDAPSRAGGSIISHSTGNKPPGAVVHLVSASEGDLGWATKLNSNLSGHIGGETAGWLTFDGRVSAHESDGKRVVMVNWNVTGSNRSAACGATSVNGRDPAAILDQVRYTFNTAAIRSNSEGRATCV